MKRLHYIFLGMSMQAGITAGLTALTIIDPTPRQQGLVGLIFLSIALILAFFIRYANSRE